MKIPSACNNNFDLLKEVRDNFNGQVQLSIGMTNKNEVQFKTYRGTWDSFAMLFADAAGFATEIGKERLISISHSEDKDDGVVTVWYWSE